MAIKQVQKNRLNSEGGFDTIHYETEAGLVLMADGTTAEDTINDKQNKLTFDETPTANSTNPVESGGVFSYVEEKIAAIPTPDVSAQIASHNTAEDAHANLTVNMVTAAGGGTLTLESVFGAGPYTIEFTEEEEVAATADTVAYDSTASGLSADNVQGAIDELTAEKAASDLSNVSDSALLSKMQASGFSGAVVYTATIGTEWTENEDTGVKSQSVAIDGITSSHTAKVDHVYTGDGTTEGYTTFVEAENQYLTYITNGYAETYDGGIIFHIFGDPNTVEVPIIVEVV